MHGTMTGDDADRLDDGDAEAEEGLTEEEREVVRACIERNRGAMERLAEL